MEQKDIHEEQYIYTFSEGKKELISLLGMKGGYLCEIFNMGLPVPPGFIITTKFSLEYFNNRDLIDKLKDDLLGALKILENATKKRFGDILNPLIVSVRAGSVAPMPGILSTILNVGINREIIKKAEETQESNKELKLRFYLDTYKTFIENYADVVEGIEPSLFHELIEGSQINDEEKNASGSREGKEDNKEGAQTRDNDKGGLNRGVQARSKKTTKKTSKRTTKKTTFNQKEEIKNNNNSRDIKRKKKKNNKRKSMSIEELKEVIKRYEQLFLEEVGEEIPQDPYIQLTRSIKAVIESWEDPRVKYYRKIHDIENYGIAVIIQEMVFGNYDKNSMAGIAISRDPITGESINPLTGERRYWGEYLKNTQGEISYYQNLRPSKLIQLKNENPEIYYELGGILEELEKLFKDIQEIEFTVESNKLYILQIRPVNESPNAKIKIAIDMMKEGILTKEEAILKVEPRILSKILYKTIDPNLINELIEKKKILDKIKKNNRDFKFRNNEYLNKDIKILDWGINASPGAVKGEAVFTPEDAEKAAMSGRKVILIRNYSRADDIYGVYSAEGIITIHGGKTSSAAVVARSLGKPAICGLKNCMVNSEEKYMKIRNDIIREGDIITIDGSLGVLIKGNVELSEPGPIKEFYELITLADKIKKLSVRANVDTPDEVRLSLEYGAEGVGLVRTEHMFAAAERLMIIRRMLLARSSEERKKALKILKPMQKEDFKEIFKLMSPKPVAIRLLDPPLQKFLPDYFNLLYTIQKLEKTGNIDHIQDSEYIRTKELLQVVNKLKESHPMLGTRGCRLGIIWPEINRMQIESIFEAACELQKENIPINLEILIPFVGFKNELHIIKEDLNKITQKILDNYGVKLNYAFGTMIEVPRAALIADEIAEEAELFSFGTNDLTQMTLAFSRDDVEEKILPKYLEKKIIKNDPFETIDTKGPGKLIQIAIELGKQKRPELLCSVSGEHASDPDSIMFFHKIGIDFLSCEPLQIPVAKLAAAQAQILFPKKEN
ncbi:MAG: putative PEP-binding protein [Promethearchaeota archaeon]